jgi:hypothetical protein
MLKYATTAAGAIAAAFVMVLCNAAALPGQAPIPLAFQLGFGANLPRGAFADVADPGSGWSIGTGVQLVDYLGIYAGYSRIRFDSTAFNGDLTDSGFSAGISVVLPDVASGIQPWLGGGIVLHRLDIAGAVDQPRRANPGLGLGGGVLLPAVGAARISPSLGYVRYRTPLPAQDELMVSYLSVGIAVNFSP